ncbi:MAG TPA: hypothetical protein VLB67_11220 [Acidimicrobiia bacterium]|nr:hypothetical protein [Acidimicrobiia bacterium]
MRRVVVVMAGVILATAALPARADHTHVRMTGNGSCVILAENGGEKYVELPHAGIHPVDRRHPLHVNVHLGEPGERGGQVVVWVRGTQGDLDNCAGYVNGN